MLVDANLLLFAVDASSPLNGPAADWLTSVLNGDRRVGLPWISLGAFLRISTHPRVWERPLAIEEAWEYIDSWLAMDVVWSPNPTERHAAILRGLTTGSRSSGNLMTDAQLAALAQEHGIEVCSADSDFARFADVRWTNPLA